MEYTDHTSEDRQLQRTMRPEQPATSAATQQQHAHHDGGQTTCPHCGAINDVNSAFCANCGEPIQTETCPNCGSAIDADTDYCEHCHHYIRPDVCSFCGAALSGSEAYCPECGSPRGGIVCPRCHTLNDFAFCRTCGEPLTDAAKELAKAMHADPDYIEMMQTADELGRIDNTMVSASEKDEIVTRKGNDIRRRVLEALAKDRGATLPVEDKPRAPRMSAEEYAALREYKMRELTAMLEKLSAPPQKKPAKVRNYAMATKPQGVRVAWECNWKHALHSSPCSCAKPQMGGHWVMLGSDANLEVDN